MLRNEFIKLIIWPMLVSVAFVISAPALLHAQTVNGTIRGTVVDEGGGLLPGVDVEVLNLGTGLVRSTLTNDQGRFRLPNIPLGVYEVSARIPGFQTQRSTDVKVTVGSEVVVDFSLPVGAITEIVTVETEAALISTTSATLSHLVSDQTVRDLPINGRDWGQLAILQPGVLQNKTQISNDPRSSVQRGSGMQLSISGSKVVDNNFRVDGININDFANSAPGSSLGTNLGVDAIQEFSVLTGNFSAQYGRASGGIINAVTRSGTNQWHGSAYEFHRNAALDAANFFDNFAGVEKPAGRRHQFGGTLG